MIDKRISKSKKIRDLKSDRSRVLYFMIYPHLDCEGRYSGDPEEIKEDCCPKLKYSIKQIAEAVVDLANVGLLVLYEDDDDNPCIEFTKFEPFQHGLRKDREAPSMILPPQDIQTNSGVTPALYLRLSLSLKKEGKKEEIYFDFNERKFFNIKEKDFQGWEEAYPACSIKAELQKMREWLLANPEKRKKNYRRFIVNWLVRTQDKGGTKKEYQISQIGESTRKPTEREITYEKTREIELNRIKKKYKGEIEKAKKAKNVDKLEEIQNAIKIELAEFSQKYHEKI